MPTANQLDEIPIYRKFGNEHLQSGGRSLPIQMIDFWQWAHSDVLGNAARGTLAEFLVGSALDALTDVRKEWMPYDLETRSGLTVEVKCAAYLQTWEQSKYSRIAFDIAPKKSWNPATNAYSERPARHASVYIFCLLDEKDQSKVDPLNLDQWKFYVVSTKTINEKLQNQKSIAIGRLNILEPIIANYEGLAEAVKRIIVS